MALWQADTLQPGPHKLVVRVKSSGLFDVRYGAAGTGKDKTNCESTNEQNVVWREEGIC